MSDVQEQQAWEYLNDKQKIERLNAELKMVFSRLAKINDRASQLKEKDTEIKALKDTIKWFDSTLRETEKGE